MHQYDRLSLWYLRKGQGVEHPPCCPVCASQYQNPEKYDDDDDDVEVEVEGEGG